MFLESHLVQASFRLAVRFFPLIHYKIVIERILRSRSQIYRDSSSLAHGVQFLPVEFTYNRREAMETTKTYTLPLSGISMNDLPRVGGKNASLGEMYRALVPSGVRVPNGFATTVEAYWDFLDSGGLRDTIAKEIAGISRPDYSNLDEVSDRIRKLVLEAEIPPSVHESIIHGYRDLCRDAGREVDVAVRSSATAEDLPTASFAGQQESFLNVRGEADLLIACRACYASLFLGRAIKYREDNHFEHDKVALSIGIQLMVRSDKGSSGVGFTLDTETGFDQVILLTGAWGLGENVVQGAVNPDEFILYKPALESGKRAVLSRKLGSKAVMMVYADDAQRKTGSRTVNVDTPQALREKYVLTDAQLEELGTWLLLIEKHYEKPMDVEWAVDGVTGELFIVQARPETVRSQEKSHVAKEYTLQEKGEVLVRGIGLGNRVVTGNARILISPREEARLKEGEILVTDITSPDWDPIMKRAGAIITNKGGRTSHAAIVARELGTLAVVGAGNATEAIKDGEQITVFADASADGLVYRGALKFSVSERDLGAITLPKTHVMMILADPDQAFRLSFYPNNGVGLMRLEFVINNWVKIHPMALVKFDELKDEHAKHLIDSMTHGYADKKHYFIERLAEGVATIAAAFYPKDVIVRMSDFKSNEYANLIGGAQFEPKEENPMIGFRGASRYYNDRYREGFALECAAMKYVREEMGLDNVKLMIPFCRTIDEGRQVLHVMEEHGLKRGENNLEIYVMAEIPSNVILADQFAKIFDGFSIGSNDLTQLVLGIDRDSAIIRDLFDEFNDAPRTMIRQVIERAHEAGRKIGLCGQAPSDRPQFAQFLVEEGIDSISFNPDAIFRGIENIHAAEETVGRDLSHVMAMHEEMMY